MYIDGNLVGQVGADLHSRRIGRADIAPDARGDFKVLDLAMGIGPAQRRSQIIGQLAGDVEVGPIDLGVDVLDEARAVLEQERLVVLVVIVEGRAIHRKPVGPVFEAALVVDERLRAIGHLAGGQRGAPVRQGRIVAAPLHASVDAGIDQQVLDRSILQLGLRRPERPRPLVGV